MSGRTVDRADDIGDDHRLSVAAEVNRQLVLVGVGRATVSVRLNVSLGI
jgi:hypothetical protein